jgi:hypothetical protein
MMHLLCILLSDGEIAEKVLNTVKLEDSGDGGGGGGGGDGDYDYDYDSDSDDDIVNTGEKSP